MVLDLFLQSPLAIGITTSILMILDMRLTWLAFQISQQGYRQFFDQQAFELNPMYQKIIHGGGGLPLRIYFTRIVFGMVIGTFVYLIGIADPLIGNTTEPLIEFLVGAIVLLYLNINLNHIGNIIQFRFIKNNPQELSGKISMSLRFTYMSIRIRTLTIGVFFGVIYLLVERIFFLAGAIEMLLLVLMMYRWESRAKNLIKEPGDGYPVKYIETEE